MRRRDRDEDSLADERDEDRRERAEARERRRAWLRRLAGDDPRESVGVSHRD